jgi:hypothetical protein
MLAILVLGTLASAQQPKLPAPVAAPVPPQIAAAHKLFISNASGASVETVTDEMVLNGGPDRPYNQFYAAMKNWGHYPLVSSPADADVVFEISWLLTDTADIKNPVLGQLRLRVVDPKTNITLWTCAEYVGGAILLGNRDKNFDRAMNALVSRIETLAEPHPVNQ